MFQIRKSGRFVYHSPDLNLIKEVRRKYYSDAEITLNRTEVITDSQSNIGQLYLTEEYTPLRLYALRKVNRNSTRSIRVRRSSDNTERDIGFVGDELDTATLLSFVGAGNGFVTRLYDQSETPIDAWNTEAAKQPFIVQSGVLVTKNGKVAIRATGTQWFKINNQNGPGGPPGFLGTSIRTEVVVASTSTISGGVIQYVTGYVSAGGAGGTIIGGDPSYYFGFGHFFGGTYVDSNVKNTNQVILASEYNGVSPNAKGSFFLNGTVYDDNTNVGTRTMNTYAIMGQSHSIVVGIVGEFQFYMSFVNSVKSQIPAITTKLNTYYGTY